MNLRNQQGFVTIGYDDHVETGCAPAAAAANQPTEPAESNDNDEGREAPEAKQSVLEESGPGQGADDGAAGSEKAGCPGGEADEAARVESRTTAGSSWASRAGSVDDLSEEDADALMSVSTFDQSTAWAPQASGELSINELHEYFSKFYSIRRIVKHTYHELKQACQGIQDLLAASSSTTSAGADIGSGGSGGGGGGAGTEAWMSSSEDQTMMSLLRTDPVLMVLGCKGSGKSAVINGILGQDILPSSSAMLKFACNGIVHLQYDDVGYVKIARTTTEVRLELELEQQQKPSQQVRAFIEEAMTEEQRSAWAALDNSVLEIGVPNAILKTRVQFLEIPGDCFDPRLRERLLRQLLVCNHQTVVYVIDGNKGLGNSDREFLFFLKANMPNMRIFFIINKVDYDPEAEEMDCESDADDDDDEGAMVTAADSAATATTTTTTANGGERFHESGVQTQRRKQRLVIDQLEKYKLASSRQSVFPVSVLRQKLPLSGSSEQIDRLNQDYRQDYQSMVTALKDCLVETGRSRMELALSTMFLVAVRTFDAFTRDPGAEAGEGARQAEAASKELITQSFRQTKEKFKQCKNVFLGELTEIHRRREEAIVGECRRLEFGPLRLYNRIRNNEVEQQYREQINNYVLHLLNVDIRESLERQINDLKLVLFEEVEKLKQMFTSASRDAPSSPWEDLIRTHAEEIVMGIVKLNFSVEWKAEAGFLKWVKKLWAGAAASKTKAASPNTPEWKSEVAREFYASIDLNAVVRKMFAGVDWTLKQAESGLLNLAHSRHKFAAKLQKMLAKDNQAARSVWLRVQFCLVSAEALRNLQAHGVLPSSCLTEPVAATCLGRLCHLTGGGYASYGDTGTSGVAATVTQIGTNAADPGAVGSWVSRLGGIPNHHLLKGQMLRSQRCFAITLMVTFTDKYELCVLHSAYQGGLREIIESTGPGKYTKAQGFQMLKDLLQIWRLFGQERSALPWSLQLSHLKASDAVGATVVYDYLENPLPTLKKGHAISRLFGLQSESEARCEKQAKELDNLLQVTFMVLVRSTREFDPDELARINEREVLEDRNREFKKYLTSLIVTGSSKHRDMDPLPADTVANLWYTKPERKVRDIEEWIGRGLQKALQQQPK